MKVKMGKYLCEFAPNNPRATAEGYVYLHVLMAEKKLGRYLTMEECVHHIDGDKYNNDLDNLMVFKTRADHSAFHKGVVAVQDGNVWHCPDKRINDMEPCPVCKIGYKDVKANMCRQCWNNSRHIVVKYKDIPTSTTNRPDRETLKDKIRNNNFVQIGKEYGVSDNAVRKWCECYGLPTKTRFIKYLSDYEWENEIFTVQND
jgi:hypothetical protein